MLGFTIEHKILIPQEKIIAALEKVNRVNLTFGVHAEDNNSHAKRDTINQKPLHKQFYNNSSTIGNAELLKKHNDGFNTTVNINDRRCQINVPKRPVLKPIIKELLEQNNSQNTIKRGLKGELEFEPDSLSQSYNILANKLTLHTVLDFVNNRGKGYWEPIAEHNNPFVSAVKYAETFGRLRLSMKKLYGKNSDLMEIIPEAEGDKPLIDSMDMLKSIKAKVNDK